MKLENKKSVFIETPIPGLVIINKPIYVDERGSLQEFLKNSEFKREGHLFHGEHAAISCSLPGIIRGIHTEEWNKLIVPITGKMFAAYADTRINSPTFGKVFTYEFDNTKPKTKRTALIIPSGVGNSICVVDDQPVYYVYLNSEEWESSKAKGIAWDDPDLNINWPVKDPIISERDKNNPRLRDVFPEKFK